MSRSVVLASLLAALTYPARIAKQDVGRESIVDDHTSNFSPVPALSRSGIMQMQGTPAVTRNMPLGNASQLSLHGGVIGPAPSHSRAPGVSMQDPGWKPDLSDDWESQISDYKPGDPRLEERITSWAPIFTVMWYYPVDFVYETPYGGAEMSPAGRSVVRLSTLAQALAFGKRLEKSAPKSTRPGAQGITYSVYKMENAEMKLKGTYPKSVNVKDARIKFRKRQPKLGGADETLLGVGGMGDDIWRELVTKASMDSVDEAWSEFRKKLELGREIEVVDENGDRVEFGDYPDEEDPEID